MHKKTIALLILATLNISLLVPIATAGITFHPKPTLIDMFKTLCNQYPTTASYTTIGKSYENRDIYIFQIGNPHGGAVMWDGCLHGWEDIGSEIEYKIANWLLTSNTPEANRILQRNYILFVPIANPDSLERGNNDFRDGATYGVDLNRNFITGFQYIPPAGTDQYPYHGRYGASEPETQALRKAFQTYRPKIYLNAHYGGGPFLEKFGANTTLSNWIETRIKTLSLAKGFTFPWSITSASAGDGFAVADANSFGANSWLWEIATDTLPYHSGSGRDGDAYMHRAQSLSDIENWYFPRMLPAFVAMCEAVESTTSEDVLKINFTGGRGWTYPLAGSYTYTSGSTATITAYNNPGWQFAYWSVDGANAGSSNPLTLAMDANHAVQAMYNPAPANYALTVLLTGGRGYTNPLPGTYTYAAGSTATITAYNNSGWQFSYWSVDGANAGSANPLIIPMNGDHTIQSKYVATTP